MAIYKYLSPSRTQAIRDATLRATQPAALNDPFELKPFFESIIRRDELYNRVHDETMVTEELKKAFDSLPASKKPPITADQFMHLINANGARQQFNQLLGIELDRLFSEHVPAMTDRFRELIYSALGTTVGIISFSEAPTQPLMWAHYADSHRGFVLGFDQSHSFFDRRRSKADEFHFLRPVNYFDPIPVYSSLSDLDGAKLLCSKHRDWQYEQEQRMLIPLPANSDPEAVHLVEFPRASLISVIIGDRTPIDVVAEIRKALVEPVYSHVRLHQAKLELASGKIRLEEIVNTPPPIPPLPAPRLH